MTLAELTRLGFTVSIVEGGYLRVAPKDLLTDELRQRILASKAQLVLEVRITDMAMWWSYTPADLDHVLAAAIADPPPWRDLVAADEVWRATNPDRRPTVESGHA